MGFVDTIKQVINIILVLLGIILNWWAICTAVGIIANKVLRNSDIANMAWKISLLPDVITATEQLVKY